MSGTAGISGLLGRGGRQHKDPCTARGISDAFRDADLLAAALDAGWSNRADLAEALQGYETARNAASRQLYDFTCQLAAFEPPSPPMQQMFEALRTDPEGTSRFFGVIAGTVAPSDFFPPA